MKQSSYKWYQWYVHPKFIYSTNSVSQQNLKSILIKSKIIRPSKQNRFINILKKFIWNMNKSNIAFQTQKKKRKRKTWSEEIIGYALWIGFTLANWLWYACVHFCNFIIILFLLFNFLSQQRIFFSLLETELISKRIIAFHGLTSCARAFHRVYKWLETYFIYF